MLLPNCCRPLTEVRHEEGWNWAKCFRITSHYGWVCTTFEVEIEALGNRDPQLIEKLLLFSARSGHTSQANLAPVGCGQHNVSTLESGEQRQRPDG